MRLVFTISLCKQKQKNKNSLYSVLKKTNKKNSKNEMETQLNVELSGLSEMLVGSYFFDIIDKIATTVSDDLNQNLDHLLPKHIN